MGELHGVTDQLRVRFNDAGGKVGRLEDWSLPQHHSQRRIAAAGNRMRVYVPYGDEWYGYFMRRLAERPANVAFFVRSLLTTS